MIARTPFAARVSFAVAVTVAMLIGALWLGFWAAGLAARWSVQGAIIVKTNMALCQVLAGAALFLLAPAGLSRPRYLLGQTAAVLVALVGLLTLSEHIFQQDLGIDQLLAKEPPGSLATVSPNRMGPPGSLSLLLFGVGLLLLRSRHAALSAYFGLAVCIVSFVPAVGILYGIPEFHQKSSLTGIAGSSVVALLLLGFGLIMARPAKGPFARLFLDDAGGRLLRRLWPSVILITLALGFLKVLGQNQNLFGTAIGTGLLVVALVVIFSILLWTSSATLSRAAVGQQTAEAELRSTALFPEENPFPVLRAARDGVLLYANRSAIPVLQSWGCSRGDVVPEPIRRVMTNAVARGEKQELEIAVGKREFCLVATPIPGRDYVNLYGHDITIRKHAEAELRQLHERLRYHIQNTPLAVIEFDAELRISAWSEGAQRIFGWTEAEVTGIPMWEIPWIFPQDRDKVAAASEGLVSGRTPRSLSRNRNVRNDGKIIWCEWYNSALADASGKMRSILSLVLDVTERERATAALRESEERFRLMADGTPLSIWITDEQGGNRFVNRAYCEFFGASADAVQGHDWLPLLHPEDAPAYRAEFEAALRKRRPFRAQTRARRHDGVWRWIESYAEPRFSDRGEFLGMSGSSSDVTERKEFQMELERLVAERTAKLQDLVNELEHFSYTITHDMRAPLRAMKGFGEIVSLMCQEWDRKEPQEFLARIITSAERMDALIRDALNYSQLVRQELPLEPVDTGVLLRGMLDSYPELQSSKAHISVEGSLPVVWGNEAGLTQCFSNLLGNAVKFVQPGQTPEIRIRAETRDGWARIWVVDQGIGISKEMLPKVFDMFTRGSTHYDGTGIGLALVRKVTQRMGGRSGVESQEGKGSRFWVELKLADP